MSETLKEDMRGALADVNIPWDEFRNGVVLVTGATGLVGGALLRVLSAANAEYGLNLRMVAHGRDKAKGEAIARECGAEFFRGDIRRPETAESMAGMADRLDYVFHCAAITKSADMAARPADVTDTEVCGTRNMLKLSLERRCRGFVYLSSMEVYGRTDLPEVRESDLGYLDLSNPRSCYPESKRFCETLCAACVAQYGLPVKIARPAQTFGAGTPKDDTRVFAGFARSALARENIVLHTEGRSRGNYCYATDAVRGLLTILLRGKDGEAYNVANPAASATIREMAEVVANEICGGGIKVVVGVPDDIQKYGYAPDVGHRLNADKLMSLGWKPKHGLAEMYKRMLADWKHL
ncbi:MAG: NAD(P)-dependent oxidoreductase [Clostridiales Family XIII bacterium]|jgi:nucleoside-diphosphate-sugar epimerase|nr:NAD(P)-dependent oxidoreductase [Clostridiales Family XIII bacterium]